MSIDFANRKRKSQLELTGTAVNLKRRVENDHFIAGIGVIKVVLRMKLELDAEFKGCEYGNGRSKEYDNFIRSVVLGYRELTIFFKKSTSTQSDQLQ